MKSDVAVKSNVRTGGKVTTKEIDKVTFIVITAVAIGFGVFAFASLAGAAVSVGLPSLFKGWMVAVGLV